MKTGCGSRLYRLQGTPCRQRFIAEISSFIFKTPFSLLRILPLLLFLCTACTSTSSLKKASFHYQMGVSYLAERNITGALIELTEAEKITPKDPELLNKLGLAYFYKQKYELAEQRYLKALKIKPNNSEVRNNLGVNYLAMSRWDDAIHQFRLVADDIFFRDQENAAINLALAHLGRGDNTEALGVLRNVVSNNPGNLLARLHLGRTYFAMGKPNLAVDEYKKALEINKDFAAAHYQLGLIYLQQKKMSFAAASFGEVVRLAPDSEIGQLSREQLDILK